MKTLNNHVIIYDDECPMCNAYTSAFVKTGMLDKNGRSAYSKIDRSSMQELDWRRARNEIALVDIKNNAVTYGVASLFAILGNSLPVLKPLFSNNAFLYIIRRFYSFISYNRKVIIPGKEFESPEGCTPDMNYPYRWAFVVSACILTSFVLVSYSRLIVPLIPPSNFYREFLMCAGQILLQGTVVWLIDKQKAIHYLGHMMTVSIGGALLLLPAFALTGLIGYGYFYAGYFMFVVTLMFAEHVRRVRFLRLPWIMSGTWVAYRFAVLYMILS